MGLMRKVFNWYGSVSPSCHRSRPPYDHVIQVGDPRLRRISECVPLEQVNSAEVQDLISQLARVQSKYNCLGLSAPQLGMNKRIFVMSHTEQQIAKTSAMLVKYRGITVIPFTVWINPVMKILDSGKVCHSEGCESVRMFCADVARYKAIEVTGYNADGAEFTRCYENWAARIAQHEIDHLDGKLYTDIMNRKSLTCSCWEQVNSARGQIAVPFHPD